MVMSVINETSSFDVMFEEMSGFFNDYELLAKDLVRARDDFFQLTGQLNESDPSFNNRMNAFLLWFTFDFRSSLDLKTPFELYCEEVRSSKPEADLERVYDFKNHVHSLFEFLKMHKEEAIVRNLFNKEKLRIVEPNFLIGSQTGIVFETRVFQIDGQQRFSNYFIQHPTEMKKPIKKRCKQIRKNGETVKPFMMTLHSYHTKWERYRNININNIYHFDKSLPAAK